MIIGIDSTAKAAGLAIDDNEYFEIEYVEDIPHKLKDLGIEPLNIEKILITIGPGSFTSLRVGLVIAQGLALPYNIPIFGYSTFLAMVEGAPIGHLMPLLYAQKKVVYAAHFNKTSTETREIFTDRVMKIEDLMHYLDKLDSQTIIFGSGAEKNRESIEGNGYSIHSSPPIAPSLIKLYKKGVTYTLNPEVPLYLALSGAYRRRERAEINLRPMEFKDLEEIFKIEQDVFPEPWDQDTFYLTFISKEYLTIVGTLDGKVVSYMIGCPEEEKFHLMNIAVAREHFRKNYGTKMLNYLLKELESSEGIKSCYLEHRIGNKAAFELYKSFGFRVAKIRPGYYGNGDDAVVMEIGV